MQTSPLNHHWAGTSEKTGVGTGGGELNCRQEIVARVRQPSVGSSIIRTRVEAFLKMIGK